MSGSLWMFMGATAGLVVFGVVAEWRRRVRSGRMDGPGYVSPEALAFWRTRDDRRIGCRVVSR